MAVAQRVEDAADAGRGDQLGHLRRGRGQQDADPGRVVDDERVERVGFAGIELGDQVRDRLVLRVQVEQHADVAELEGAVHQDDRLAELRRRGHRKVDRDRRPADAALRAEDRDDLPIPTAVLGSVRRRPDGDPGDRHRAHPAELLLLARVDLPDGGGELVAAKRLDEELAGAGEHRPTEVVRLALDRHHHDRRGRDLGRQLLRRGDAVHVRHVDVHQHDIGLDLARHGHCFVAGRSRADHLDVRLESEQLREVVAGLGDVVHDQDADLVGHSFSGSDRS